MDHSKISNKQLHDTRNFFRFLDIPSCFLTTDPETWLSNESYLEAESDIRELRVVNDTAERGVALMQDYSAVLTKNAEHMQFALLVVKEHLQRYPDVNKSTTVKGLNS